MRTMAKVLLAGLLFAVPLRTTKADTMDSDLTPADIVSAADYSVYLDVLAALSNAY